MRTLKLFAVTLGLLLLGIVSYRQETASRYHLDTLRKESYCTTRIFGLPVARRQTFIEDDYSKTYLAITGTEPLQAHWHQMRADYIRSLWGAENRCFGLGYELRERRNLLQAVYSRFPAPLTQTQAAAYLRRIDELVPVDFNQRREPNLEQIHLLRKELGLKSYHDE